VLLQKHAERRAREEKKPAKKAVEEGKRQRTHKVKLFFVEGELASTMHYDLYYDPCIQQVIWKRRHWPS